MSSELTWCPSPAASALHAAQLVGCGRSLTNSVLSESVRLPAERLQRELIALELPHDVVWSELICHAREGTESGRRSAAALRAAGLSEEQVARASGRVAERVAEIESTHAAAFPDLSRELQLRCGPLRQLWEERGPGLLRNVGTLMGVAAPLQPATVIVAQPALGGGGRAFPSDDSILIEAVLANPSGSLPEVARLGWLLAQLYPELRQVSPAADEQQETRLRQLALLPAALEAAQFVELAHFDGDTLAQAVASWPFDPPVANAANQLAERLLAWWDSFRETRPPWDAALARLRSVIGDGSTDP
jgi:hypothetical protein